MKIQKNKILGGGGGVDSLKNTTKNNEQLKNIK